VDGIQNEIENRMILLKWISSEFSWDVKNYESPLQRNRGANFTWWIKYAP